MGIRDILVLALVLGCAAAGFFRPWLGVCGFAWVSYMNPHRLTWTFAYDFPVAMVIAIPTLAGIIVGNDKMRIRLEREGVFLALLWIWFCVTTLFALNPQLARPELLRISKILFMTFITMFLLTDRNRVRVFLAVIIGSIGFLAFKGALFSVRTGGAYRVFGPPGSFLADNNDFAHAICMVFPLLVWWASEHRRSKWRWVYWLLVASASASVLMTYSRGGFLTLVGVLGVYWLRSSRKVIIIMGIALGIAAAIPLLPDAWFQRISSIDDYQHDASTQGRFNAWRTGWNVVCDRPILGGGFQTYTRKTFARYSPDPDNVHDVHSVYFEILGEQGWPGAFLFFGMIGSAMRSLLKMKKHWSSRGDTWAAGLCDALFISFVGYLGGGLFLGRVSFDLFYHLIALVVVLKGILNEESIQEHGSFDTEITTGGSIAAIS